MPNSNFNRNYAFVGTDVELDLGFSAKTALETPQILLTWTSVPEFVGGFRIVRRQRHYSKDENDGFVVFSAEGAPSQTFYADTLIRPETSYYYQVFYRIDTVWYTPKNGRDWAFSGTDWAFEESGEETQIFYSDGGSIGESNLATGGDRVGVLSPIFSVGDWALVGETDPQYVLVTATEASTIKTPDLILFEPVGVVADSSTPSPVERTALTFKKSNPSFSNLSTIQRGSGNFLLDGYRNNMTVRVRGSAKNDGDWKVSTVYSQLLVLATGQPTLLDEGAVTGPYILGPPGNIGKEKIKKVLPRSSFLASKVYQDYLPDSFREDDQEVNQARLLVSATLTDGQKVNIGVPGTQQGLQRWIRSLLIEFDRARAAIHALPALYEGENSPTDFLRRLAATYAVSLPDDLTADRLRTLVRSQPHLVRRRGRLDAILSWLEILSGLKAKLTVNGSDRVVRFDELASGFVWDGQGFVDAVTATTLTDNDANFPVNGFVGYRLHPDASESTIEDSIVSNTATVITTAGNLNLANETGPGIPYLVSIPPRANEGWQTSLYDRDPGGVFNDKGLFIFLEKALTSAQKLEVTRVFKDFKPATVSLLVLLIGGSYVESPTFAFPGNTTEIDLTG